MGVFGTGLGTWAVRIEPIMLCIAAIFICLYTEPPQDKNKTNNGYYFLLNLECRDGRQARVDFLETGPSGRAVQKVNAKGYRRLLCEIFGRSPHGHIQPAAARR
jgi:hypothetical protein